MINFSRRKGSIRQKEDCFDNKPCVDRDANPHQFPCILVGKKIKKNFVKNIFNFLLNFVVPIIMQK